MKAYNKTTPIKITVEGGLSPDRSLQLTVNAYSTLEEWVEAFKVVLLHQTFSEDTIKELFDTNNIIDDSYDDSDECCGVCVYPTGNPRADWKNEF